MNRHGCLPHMQHGHRKDPVRLKKPMQVCQKLQDALKCRCCQKQFGFKTCLNYYTAQAKPSDPEASSLGSQQEEREQLCKVLKQMGGCAARGGL